VVTCCVVTKCCEVKVVTVKAEVKEAKEVKAVAVAAVAKAPAGAAAAAGSGQAVANANTQTSTITQTMGAQTSGAISGNTAPVNVYFGSQTATSTQTNIPVTVQIKDVTINPIINWDASKTINAGTTNTGDIA
jgi:hypothetical protein